METINNGTFAHVYTISLVWLAFWYIEVNVVMLWQQGPELNHLDSDICSSISLKQRTRSMSKSK